MPRGRFVVLEGGEACGKSTQAARLASALGAVATREPGGTALGERLRDVILSPGSIADRAETLLLLAARAQHVAEVIEPALASGRDVVCDRFSGSTLAYQGYGRALPVAELASLSAWAAGGLAPDRVILLSVPATVAADRLAARGGGADRLEGEGAAFFARVAEGFDALAAGDPAWRVVDGVGPVAEVAARVLAAAVA